MKLYLVRHSEVVEKYLGRYNGHIDIPLSEKGRTDAKRLGKKLSHIRFERAFCSDLLRARQTIEAFDLSCDIVYSDRLREKSWGRHEGKNFEEIVEEGVVYRNFEQWIDDLDGEPFERYSTRLQEYFEKVLLKQEARNVLVVTHAGVIKTLLALYGNVSVEKAFCISIPYGECIVYETKRGSFVL